MKLIYPLNVKNEFVFNSSPRDFTVEEIPLYEFTGEGEHLVLQVRKKEMTTWEMLDAISNHVGIRRRDMGYAGLKDKHAMTIQYISVMAIHEEKLKAFTHDKIKILSSVRHNNKIRVGHLKGNRFNIRLKKVLGVQKDKLDSVLKWIKTNGVPNYFGNQRFGTDGNNWEDGRKLVAGTLKMRDRKTREFLMGSYQSYLFNNWLSKRMELNHLLEKFSETETEQIMELPQGSLKDTKKQPNFFKLVEGDTMMHYPYGRVFNVEDLEEEAKRFERKDIAPAGLLPGKKMKLSTSTAGLIEASFVEEMNLNGARRYAWIQVTEITKNYVEEKAHYELSFVLPKGCYATNVLDVLRGQAV
ncbi:tRNA pseudouridine(13) synthase TruD [Sulfurovum sp.]|uniref:tRNA pseudouridine(13) synthase TruD n=1 Tax=Sulfurovum sp. TaxID=1969726 RepID=UPI002867C3DB|nr:tRNA pseudouridine(13) synthase TruD [Sulfurovum sp.]